MVVTKHGSPIISHRDAVLQGDDKVREFLVLCVSVTRWLYLFQWMTQYGLQLCLVSFARIAKIDLVMLAVLTDTVSIAIFESVCFHSFDRGRLGGIRTDMHRLHAHSFFEFS